MGGHLVPPFEAYAGDEPYIFISYAHKDSAQVFKEISQLNDAGYHIWYDEGIEASSEWPEEIANAVIGCSVFLVFISPRSTASVNCRNEINLALNEDKPFLAVHMEDSALPPGLRLRMGDLQAILQYKLPQDRYQKKVRDALDQLLGKKKKKIRSRPATATATTFAKMESNDAAGAFGSRKQTGKKKIRTASAATSKSQTVQPKKKKSGLWFGIAAALIAAIGGYSFLASDGGEDGDSSASFVEGQPWTVPSIGLAMNWCEPGVFFMGSPGKEKGRKDDETRHEVTLTQGFFLGKFEVTQAQWKAVMGTSPSKFFGPNRPVEQVSWDQAKRFCEELTVTEQKAGRLLEGWSYDLPTEAQWEYACRAGTDTIFYWGSAIGPSNANFKGSGVGGQTTEVGKYPPNAWGFHDMSGNVNELCSDWYAKFNSLAKVDPIGPDGGKEKSIKGGAWNLEIKDLRVAFRWREKRGHKSAFKGFRLCLKQAPPERSEIEEAVKASETSGLDLNRGLAGWWTFDEKSGKVANDSSGKIRAGKLVGYSSDTTQWSKGVIGNALRFDGKGSHVDIGDFEWGGESSVSFWSRWEASHRRSRVLTLSADVNDGDNSFQLGNEFSLRNFKVNIFQRRILQNINFEAIKEFKNLFSINQWIHLSFVFKESDLMVFKNGKLLANHYCIFPHKALRKVQLIGGSENTDVGFKGQLDDFRMYDRAITPAEVEGLFALGKQPQSVSSSTSKVDLDNGLAGWWKFDETKGKVANDSSGKKRNGELKDFDSDTAQWVKGPVGNALRFDGKNDYVDVGDFEWGGECSFSGWVKYNKIQFWSRVFDFGNGTGKDNIVLSNQSRSPNLVFENWNKSSKENKYIPDFWQLGDWIYIVCQVHESGKLDIFKNGKLISSSIRKLTPKIFRKGQFFGKSNWSENSYLNGELDDLRLYDRAITVPEVQALYGMGEASK